MNPYAPPASEERIDPTRAIAREGVPALWNPSAAANWSLIFTPAFGSYLQMLNWRALGEQTKAAQASGWFFASLGMLLAEGALGALGAASHSTADASRSVGLVYLIVWYFAAGRPQIRYIKAHFGRSYPRKSWMKPLLIAVCISGGLVVALGALLALATLRVG
jgi:hypothetical protein